MKVLNYIKLDIKNILRDPIMLSMASVVPLLFAVALFWLLPFGLRSFVWLRPWEAQIVTFCVMQIGILMGAVTAFMILDDRDESSLQALMATPLSQRRYLVFRLGIPVVYTFVLSLVLLLIAKSNLSSIEIIGTSVLNSLLVPLFSLSVTSLASNKVEGLTWVKGINLIAFLPVASFFIESGWRKILGIIPTYWIYHYNAIAAQLKSQQPEGAWAPFIYFLISFVFLVVCNMVLTVLFSKKI